VKDYGEQAMRRMKMSEADIEKFNFKNRTATEQQEIARQGGKASGAARRRKKSLKELGDMIGSLSVKSEKNKAIMREAGIEDEDMIRDTAMLFMLEAKAEKGDTNAIALIAKIRGQLKEQVQAEVAEVKPLVDLTKRPKNGEQA
jgi:hypothetical protein